MKKNYELIIFDWDGTLADSIDWIVHCIRDAAIKIGYQAPEKQAIRNIIGLSIHKAIDTLFPKIDDQSRHDLIGYYRQTFFSKQISEKDLFDGVKTMLDCLKLRGYRMAIATGKTASGLEKAMLGTGLHDFFHSTQSADQTASKPDPLMIEMILTELGVEKQNAVFVGDSIHDMQMAINAGIDSIAVSCGANTHEQLQRFNPMNSFQKTTEILTVL